MVIRAQCVSSLDFILQNNSLTDGPLAQRALVDGDDGEHFGDPQHREGLYTRRSVTRPPVHTSTRLPLMDPSMRASTNFVRTLLSQTRQELDVCEVIPEPGSCRDEGEDCAHVPVSGSFDFTCPHLC